MFCIYFPSWLLKNIVTMNLIDRYFTYIYLQNDRIKISGLSLPRTVISLERYNNNSYLCVEINRSFRQTADELFINDANVFGYLRRYINYVYVLNQSDWERSQTLAIVKYFILTLSISSNFNV